MVYLQKAVAFDMPDRRAVVTVDAYSRMLKNSSSLDISVVGHNESIICSVDFDEENGLSVSVYSPSDEKPIFTHTYSKEDY